MTSTSDRMDDDVIVITGEDVVDEPRRGAHEAPHTDDRADLTEAELAAADAKTEAVPDASVPDASVPDASVPDASVPDASVPDASVADASVADASVPDRPVTGQSGDDYAGNHAADSDPGADWPQIQAMFVDDPRRAVESAAAVSSAALAALVATARDRDQTLRQEWQGDGTGTEELRTALRHYRSLASQLKSLAGQL